MLPRKAAESLSAKAGDIIGIYQEGEKVFLKKMQ